MQKRFVSALIAGLVLIFAAMLLLLFAGLDEKTDTDSKIIKINEAYLLENAEKKSFSLPQYADVNDKAVVYVPLSYSFPENSVPKLIMQANHSFITIFLNEEEIFSVKETAYSQGNYYTCISMPQSLENAELRIELTAPEKGVKRLQVSEITIAEEAQYLKTLLFADFPSLLLNIVIIFCGALMLLLALFDRKYFASTKMLLRALLAIDCAVYFMCETASFVFIANAPRLIYYLDMLSFGIISVPLLVLFGEEMDGWRKKLLNTASALTIVTMMIQLILVLLGAAEFRAMLPLTHAVQFLGVAAGFVSLAASVIKKQKPTILYTGFLIVIGGALDLVLFITEISLVNMFFLKTAVIIYFFQQFIQFIAMLMAKSAEKEREIYYKALALQDPMTNCYSRAAFEIDKQQWKSSAPRAVFFMDLNNLKEVNDKFGHSEGDRLIKAFGDILNNVFQTVGKCYRVGGDEFWIFCDMLTQDKAENIIKAAAKATEEYNRKSENRAPLKYAVGFAETTETQGNLEEAIRLADTRMYADKRETKRID